MNLKEINQSHFNILLVALARTLIRSGSLQKENLIAEIAQQGIPPELAFGIINAN